MGDVSDPDLGNLAGKVAAGTRGAAERGWCPVGAAAAGVNPEGQSLSIKGREKKERDRDPAPDLPQYQSGGDPTSWESDPAPLPTSPGNCLSQSHN